MPILRQNISSKGKDASASRRVLLIIALCLFVVALSLVILQSIPGTKILKNTVTTVEKTNPLPNIPQPILVGTIKSISGSAIVVEIPAPINGSKTTKTVTVASDTKIVKSVLIDAQEFSKKMDEYTKAMKAYAQPDPKKPTPSTIPTPPSPTNEVDSSLNNLAIGQSITAVPKSDLKDVRTVDTFTASKIILLDLPKPPQAATNPAPTVAAPGTAPAPTPAETAKTPATPAKAVTAPTAPATPTVPAVTR